MFRTLIRIVFPPRIPPQLAERYVEGHRSLLAAIQHSKAVWDGDPVLREQTRPDIFPEGNYRALWERLSLRQQAIDRAMEQWRRGRSAPLHSEAFTDTSLGRVMDSFYFGWGGPACTDAILAALHATASAAADIRNL